MSMKMYNAFITVPVVIILLFVECTVGEQHLQHFTPTSAAFRVICSESTIGLLVGNISALETDALRVRRMFASRHQRDADCVYNVVERANSMLRFELPHEFTQCGVRSRRLTHPHVGIEHSIRLVISYSPVELTEDDRAFALLCRYFVSRADEARLREFDIISETHLSVTKNAEELLSSRLSTIANTAIVVKMANTAINKTAMANTENTIRPTDNTSFNMAGMANVTPMINTAASTKTVNTATFVVNGATDNMVNGANATANTTNTPDPAANTVNIFATLSNDEKRQRKSPNTAEIVEFRQKLSAIAMNMRPTAGGSILTDLLPKCDYTLHLGSPDGPIVESARLGQKIFHRWKCEGDAFALKVHKCDVYDGATQRYALVDENGCTADATILPRLIYAHDHGSVHAPSTVFRFSNASRILFKCLIYVCRRADEKCLESVQLSPACNETRAENRFKRGVIWRERKADNSYLNAQHTRVITATPSPRAVYYDIIRRSQASESTRAAADNEEDLGDEEILRQLFDKTLLANELAEARDLSKRLNGLLFMRENTMHKDKWNGELIRVDGGKAVDFVTNGPHLNGEPLDNGRAADFVANGPHLNGEPRDDRSAHHFIPNRFYMLEESHNDEIDLHFEPIHRPEALEKLRDNGGEKQAAKMLGINNVRNGVTNEIEPANFSPRNAPIGAMGAGRWSTHRFNATQSLMENGEKLRGEGNFVEGPQSKRPFGMEQTRFRESFAIEKDPNETREPATIITNMVTSEKLTTVTFRETITIASNREMDKMESKKKNPTESLDTQETRKNLTGLLDNQEILKGSKLLNNGALKDSTESLNTQKIYMNFTGSLDTKKILKDLELPKNETLEDSTKLLYIQEILTNPKGPLNKLLDKQEIVKDPRRLLSIPENQKGLGLLQNKALEDSAGSINSDVVLKDFTGLLNTQDVLKDSTESLKIQETVTSPLKSDNWKNEAPSIEANELKPENYRRKHRLEEILLFQAAGDARDCMSAREDAARQVRSQRRVIVVLAAGCFVAVCATLGAFVIAYRRQRRARFALHDAIRID